MKFKISFEKATEALTKVDKIVQLLHHNLIKVEYYAPDKVEFANAA